MEKYFVPEKVFLIFILLTGFFFVFFIPPFQSQDEPNHFKRAYSVAVLKIFSLKQENKLGNMLPCAIQDFINAASDTGKEVVYAHSGYKYSFKEFKKLSKYKITKDKQCFLNYPNMARYSPIAYLPQSLGIFLASLFTQKVLFLFLAGRIFNLIFYAILCFYAIKTTPYLKWIFVLVLSNPMSLALAASMSADAVLIGCCSLFFAKILQYAFSQQNYLSKKQLCFLALIAAMIALTKQSIAFLLFIFLLPKAKIKTNYFWTILLVLLPSIVLSALWSFYAASVMIPLNNSDAASHLSFIISNPFYFLILVLKTFFNIELLFQTIGVLGWKNIYLDIFYYVIFVFVVCINIFYQSDSRINLNTLQKIIIIFTAIINILLICILSFLYWTYKTTFSYIELQGRYLLPFVLPFLVFISSFVNSKNCRYAAILNTAFLFLSGIYLILKITQVYTYHPL